MAFERSEVEEAFAHWWSVGNSREDWWAWTDLFTPDVHYVDHFWGPLHGRDEVRLWIEAVMKGVPEIYTYLDWYRIDDYRVTPDGKCPDCDHALAGRYEKFTRAFGPRRIPVAIHRP